MLSEMSAEAVTGSENPNTGDESVKEKHNTKEEEDDDEWESFEEEYTLLAEVDGLDAALMQQDLSYTLVVCVVLLLKQELLLFLQSCAFQTKKPVPEVFNREQRLKSQCCALERSSMRVTMLTLLALTCFLTRTRRTKAQEARDQVFRTALLDRAPSASFSSVSRLFHARRQSPPSDVLHRRDGREAGCCNKPACFYEGVFSPSLLARE